MVIPFLGPTSLVKYMINAVHNKLWLHPIIRGALPSASSFGPFELTAEFEKLGTYKVSYTITAKHDNNTPSDTNDDVSYTATGAYTFHVGPIGRTGGAKTAARVLYVAADRGRADR